jgi:hypothetical protein
LSLDDVDDDLKAQGWDTFIKMFDGYNLHTTKEFSQIFDGYREKFGDIQLEATKGFISEATGHPFSGQKWFKNSKIDKVPWNLFMTSRKIDCCEKGILVSLLKVRWHGLLSVLKHFITCECLYGQVFLYHVRFLMHFIGFHMNVLFYLLRSLYKKQSLDSSLFHHGLIKMLLVHHLTTLGDYWDGFLARNTFFTSTPKKNPMLDKPMIEKHVDFPSDKPTFLEENPRDEAIPNQFLYGKHDVGCEFNETPKHDLIVVHNPTVKSDSKYPHK